MHQNALNALSVASARPNIKLSALGGGAIADLPGWWLPLGPPHSPRIVLCGCRGAVRGELAADGGAAARGAGGLGTNACSGALCAGVQLWTGGGGIQGILLYGEIVRT